MGSPVSVVVADLVMEKIEEKAISTFVNPPRLFKRYVDDSICVIKKDQVKTFHKHLDKQHKKIQFTVEEYSPKGIPFLDSLNKIRDDGSIDITVYRKKTHSDRYLSFESHHDPQHKASVVHTLYKRAESHPNTDQEKEKEQQLVFEALRMNNYPKPFITKYRRVGDNRRNDQDTPQEVKGYAVLPYVKGVTERVRRVLSQQNIKVATKPVNTIRQIVSKPKDRVEDLKKTGVIYQIPCSDCTTVYIGETGRALHTRRAEHERNVRLAHTEKSALSEHANSLDHNIDWDGIKVLKSEPKYHQRKWLEALMIANTTSVLSNRDTGRTLPETYRPLLKFM